MDTPLILEVAVNGATTRAAHPRVPLTADEIVADARACAAAGAAVFLEWGALSAYKKLQLAV